MNLNFYTSNPENQIYPDLIVSVSNLIPDKLTQLTMDNKYLTMKTYYTEVVHPTITYMYGERLYNVLQKYNVEQLKFDNPLQWRPFLRGFIIDLNNCFEYDAEGNSIIAIFLGYSSYYLKRREFKYVQTRLDKLNNWEVQRNLEKNDIKSEP